MMNWLIAAAVSAGKGPQITFGSIAAVDTEISPTDATCSITCAGGTLNATDESPTSHTWLNYGAAADFDIKVSGAGVTPSGSAIDTWINCATNPQWSLTETATGDKQFTGTWSISRTGQATSLGSGTFSLHVIVDF